jgi:hypothetical protein
MWSFVFIEQRICTESLDEESESTGRPVLSSNFRQENLKPEGYRGTVRRRKDGRRRKDENASAE